MTESKSDYHNVTLNVSCVRDGQIDRNPHQAITAIVNVKLSPVMAKTVIEKLQLQLDNHTDGMDDVTMTLEGVFT